VKNIDVLLNPFLADDIGGAAKGRRHPDPRRQPAPAAHAQWANRFI